MRFLVSGDIKRTVQAVIEASSAEEAAAKAARGESDEVVEEFQTPGDEETFEWDGNDPAPEDGNEGDE